MEHVAEKLGKTMQLPLCEAISTQVHLGTGTHSDSTSNFNSFQVKSVCVEMTVF